jgi:hypothetical protein
MIALRQIGDTNSLDEGWDRRLHDILQQVDDRHEYCKMIQGSMNVVCDEDHDDYLRTLRIDDGPQTSQERIHPLDAFTLVLNPSFRTADCL